MKILWNENPLASVIELDDHDKQILWHRIKIYELGSLITSIEVSLEDGDIKGALREANSQFLYCDEGAEKSGIDKIVDHTYKWALASATQPHAGDCVCYAVSCRKCMLEEWLELDTIKGLRKGPASFVNGQFSDKTMTLNTAIGNLQFYNPTLREEDFKYYTAEQWNIHAKRWIEEAHEAAKWLIEYRKQHFM